MLNADFDGTYAGWREAARAMLLAEIPPDQMLARLDREVAAWSKADPSTPVVPALHLIVVVAQGAPTFPSTKASRKMIQSALAA